jgi:NADH:ubiquinone oxidoreductase subunit F (NADH-binding)
MIINAAGGYQAFEKCLTQLTPEQVIEELKVSG